MRRSLLLPLVAALPALALPSPALPALGGTLELPPIRRETMPNGLSVLVVATSRVPLVQVRALVRAGSAQDPAGREGLASLTSELLIRGAGARDALQVAEDAAFVGGTLGTGCDAESMVLAVETLSRDFPLALELVSDALAVPRFEDAEVARARQEAEARVRSARDEPGALADRELRPLVWGDGPLGHPPAGWECSVPAIDASAVRDFHRTYVVPGRTILAVVGDVDAESALAAVRKALGSWKGGHAATTPAESAGRGRAPRRRLVTQPGVTQAQIRLAGDAIPRSHRDFAALEVCNTILGGGFTSRLVDRVRVTEGLTYRIGSYLETLRGSGLLVVTTFTRNEKLRACLEAIRAETRKLAKEGPSAEELRKAQQYLVGLQPMGLQAPVDLASKLLEAEALGLGESELTGYRDRILAVTIQDCRRVLGRYLDVDRMDLLVVGDPAAVAGARAATGTLDVRPPAACGRRPPAPTPRSR